MKKKLLISLISILAGLNMLRWYVGNDIDQSDKVADLKQFNEKLVTLDLNFDDTQKENRIGARNPFIPWEEPKPIITRKIIVQQKKAPVQLVPPPPTAEEIANKLAMDKLSRLQLLGIVEEGGLRKAFILYETNSFVVRSGEQFATDFRMGSITDGGVQVMELTTNISHQLSLRKQ